MSTIVLVTVGFYCGNAFGAAWESNANGSTPGSFPLPRPMRVKYAFSWSGIPAATAELHLTNPAADRLRVEAALHTTGLVDTLWKFEATHSSLADTRTLHPIEVQQVETHRSKTLTTALAFDGKGVTSKRSEAPAKHGPKTRRFDAANVFDLQTSLLYFRSQPLQNGNVQRVVVYPATSSYLATVTVIGREKVTVPAGTFNAIKLDLQLNKIGKNRELEPHRKFRHGTVWLSDDPDRLVVKIEAQIFVGTVLLELQNVEFEDAKPHLRVD